MNHEVNIQRSLSILMSSSKMTQKDLSKKTGIAQSSLSMIVNGAGVSIKTIKTLALAFDLRPSEFIALGEEL